MLHDRQRIRDRAEEAIFGSAESQLMLPKYRIPQNASRGRGKPGAEKARAPQKGRLQTVRAAFCLPGKTVERKTSLYIIALVC